MPRDLRLVRRNALAIPGAILLVHGLLLTIWLTAMRSSDNACGNAYRFLVRGACYSGLPLGLVLLALGVVLLVIALLALKGTALTPSNALRAGTPTHVALGLLASLVIVPLALGAGVSYIENGLEEDYVSEVRGYLVKTTFLLQVVAFLALLALVTMAWTLAAGAARRRAAEAMSASTSGSGRFPGEGLEAPARALSTAPEGVARIAPPEDRPAKPLSWSAEEPADKR